MAIAPKLTLVTLAPGVSRTAAAAAADALDRQIREDFAPAWGMSNLLPEGERWVEEDELELVPLDRYPVILVADLAGLLNELRERAEELERDVKRISDPDYRLRAPDLVPEPPFELPDVLGVHIAPATRQPLALVDARGEWTMQASHECLELLADPYANLLVGGPPLGPELELEGDYPIQPPPTGSEEWPPRSFQYLVEPCDPCIGISYSVDGFTVSDFCTPAYYTDGDGPYTSQESIAEPRQLLDGGYLSFVDPHDQRLWQFWRSAAGAQYLQDLGLLVRKSSLRERVDSQTRPRAGQPREKGEPTASELGGPLDATLEDRIGGVIELLDLLVGGHRKHG